MAIDATAENTMQMVDELQGLRAEMAPHMQRVELLCDLVTAMMKAMIDSPIGAMLPPDIVRQVRGL